MIYTIPDYSIQLHNQAEEVIVDCDATRDTIAELKKHIPLHGMGLAAPQIGRSEMVIIAQIHDQPPGDPETMTVMINPYLILRPEKGYLYPVEGCLSIPDETYLTQRYETVFVTYFDEQGQPHGEELHGFPAVVVQHEVDHLLGILVSDHGKRLLPQDDVTRSN